MSHSSPDKNDRLKQMIEDAPAGSMSNVRPDAGCPTCGARSSAIEPTFAAAALRFVKAHIESDRLDRHDDVEQVDAEVYDKADAEYNESKTAMVRAYKAMASTDGKGDSNAS